MSSLDNKSSDRSAKDAAEGSVPRFGALIIPDHVLDASGDDQQVLNQIMALMQVHHCHTAIGWYEAKNLGLNVPRPGGFYTVFINISRHLAVNELPIVIRTNVTRKGGSNEA